MNRDRRAIDLIMEIESLQPGEGMSRMIVDAGELRTSVDGNRRNVGSMRIEAFRSMNGTLKLQAQISDIEGDWTAYEVGDDFLESYPDEDERIEDALAMFQVYAVRYASELRHGDNGLATAEREERRRAENANEEGAEDPLYAILALNVGENWTEEGWGPWYQPAAVDFEGGYPIHELRIFVERQDLEHRPFRLVVQARGRAYGVWKDDDLGLSPGDAFVPFQREANERTLAATLTCFRATLEVERAEVGEDTEAIAEREAYGITDEHLRTGTLSERSRAELEAQTKEAA